MRSHEPLARGIALLLGREVTEKLDDLKAKRLRWEDDWEEITRFVMPRRSVWDNSQGRGDRVGQEIYDGTAISALTLMANGLMGYLMGPMLKWFKLGFPIRQAMDAPGAKQWLQIAENVLYSDFARSTLYEEGLEFFKDGGSVGTATMYAEEDDEEGTPFFSCRHPKEIYLAGDRRNRIDTVFRVFSMTARQIRQEFGDDLPEIIKRAVTETPGTLFEIVHAVFPRDDRDVTQLTKKNKKFASVYLDLSSQEILREGGYDELPYITWRWSTNSDELYGRSPAHDALIKIKRANAMNRDLLRFSQKAADPPYNAPESMRGRVNILPRGINYFARPDMQVTPVQLGGAFPIALDQQQDVRAQIETDFLVDFFLMLQRAPERMTATEVMERQAEKAAVLGPIIGRIESDVLDKVIRLGFRQAMRTGRIPPPPPSVQRMIGVPLKIEYIGPLAQANRKFHSQQGIQSALSQFVPMLNVEPGLKGLIKWEDLGRTMLETAGMPADVVRDRREYRQWEDQMAKAQEAQMKREQEAQVMQNADKLSKQPQPGSPLEMLARQAAGVMGTAQGAPPQ